jgi:hypothetical protein
VSVIDPVDAVDAPGVGGVVIVCVSADELEPALFVSPLYTAVIECDPPDVSPVVRSVPTPEMTGTVPRDLVPSKNDMYPPPPPPTQPPTVPMSVVEAPVEPDADGFCDEVTVSEGVETVIVVRPPIPAEIVVEPPFAA